VPDWDRCETYRLYESWFHSPPFWYMTIIHQTYIR